jgi:colicin import membrane protein
MLETHIKILASLYTLMLIAAVGSLLIFGGFKFKTHSVKGQVISATMIDISQLKSLNKPNTTKKKTVKEPIEKKIKKPIEKQPKPPVVKPIKKPVNEPIKKPVIKPKIDTKAVALERKKTIERQKKLEEIRKKKIIAKQKSEQAEQDLKDLANKIKEEDDEPTIVNIGSNNGDQQANERNQLIARYQLAVISKVEKQWNKPASANKNLLCHVKVRQIPGGGVIDATISSPCNANAIVKKSIIAAIIKADPLPFKGFEKVFARTSTFIFQPQD